MCLEEYVQRAVREQERAVHTNEKRGQNTTKSKMIWVLDEAFLEREFEMCIRDSVQALRKDGF